MEVNLRRLSDQFSQLGPRPLHTTAVRVYYLVDHRQTIATGLRIQTQTVVYAIFASAHNTIM